MSWKVELGIVRERNRGASMRWREIERERNYRQRNLVVNW